MRVSDFLLSVTCSGVSADIVAAYLALVSARLPRLDSEVVEPFLNKSSSLVRLRLSCNTIRLVIHNKALHCTKHFIVTARPEPIMLLKSFSSNVIISNYAQLCLVMPNNSLTKFYLLQQLLTGLLEYYPAAL